MADETSPLLTLDEADARRVERLLVQRAAIEAEITLIFTRASRAMAPVQVVFGAAPKSTTFIVGGHTVGSVYITTASGCGVYDIGDMVCQEIPCDQVPGHQPPVTLPPDPGL
jgi:hypothetical protein